MKEEMKNRIACFPSDRSLWYLPNNNGPTRGIYFSDRHFKLDPSPILGESGKELSGYLVRLVCNLDGNYEER